MSRHVFDIAIVGYGLHSLSLLASQPDILKYDVVVIERVSPVSGGSLARYLVSTNSWASKFLKPFFASEFLGPCFAGNPRLSSLANTQESVPCKEIGAALATMGNFFAATCNRLSLFLGSSVNLIEFQNELGFTLHLACGDSLNAKVVVLATGRVERLHSSLRHVSERVVFSAPFLAEGIPYLERTCGFIPRRMAILGSAHSAFSVLELLSECSDLASQEIDIYFRSPIALYYSSLSEALAVERTPGEREIDSGRDVCPETGAVFRDSGLRGKGKLLYKSIVRGKLPTVRLLPIVYDTGNERQFLDYDCVIQAIGGVPNVPKLTINHQPIWKGDGRDRIAVDLNSRAILTTLDEVIVPLYLLRVIPTLATDKDVNPWVHNAYPAILADIARIIGKPNFD